MFGEKEKQEIAKFAWEHGNAAAIRKFKEKFLTLLELLSDLNNVVNIPSWLVACVIVKIYCVDIQ